MMSSPDMTPDLPFVVSEHIESMADEVASVVVALTKRQQVKAWTMLIIAARTKTEKLEAEADEFSSH